MIDFRGLQHSAERINTSFAEPVTVRDCHVLAVRIRPQYLFREAVYFGNSHHVLVLCYVMEEDVLNLEH